MRAGILLLVGVAAGSFFCAGTAGAATPRFQNAVAASNPLLYYPLNEASGNAANHGSLGASYDAAYNGTPNRAVATQSGDTGVGFDSSDDSLTSLATAPASLTGNPTFSVEALVFIPATGTATLWPPILHWGAGTGSGTAIAGKEVYFSFSQNDPTRIFAGFYNGGVRTVSPLALGVWHHVVWTRVAGGTDQTGSIVYVDGATVATEPDPGLCCNGSTPNVTLSPFHINRGSDFVRFFVGSLDEVALYDHVLTASDVTQHYAAFVNQSVPAQGRATTAVEALALLVLGVVLLRQSSHPGRHAPSGA
jgi:hypothetical protein